jgi:hypothetical protein
MGKVAEAKGKIFVGCQWLAEHQVGLKGKVDGVGVQGSRGSYQGILYYVGIGDVHLLRSLALRYFRRSNLGGGRFRVRAAPASKNRLKRTWSDQDPQKHSTQASVGCYAHWIVIFSSFRFNSSEVPAFLLRTYRNDFRENSSLYLTSL